MKIVNENAPLDQLVLKMHLFAEAHLYRLLSLRLDIDEEHLPSLQFFALAKLGLGGESYKTTLVKVLALKDLRNEFAHELDEERLSPAFAKFCAKTEMFWLPYDVAGKPEQFESLRVSAVVSGAITCVNEIWAHMARLVAERLAAQGKDTSELRTVILKSEEVVRGIAIEQNSIRHMFPK